MNNANAIIMLCMMKEHYVIGACINAFVSKSLMFSKNINNIKMVVMCDDFIYEKHKDLLVEYFDEVIKIDLMEHKIIDIDERKHDSWSKKYSWIMYSLNKWQILKFEKYNKVLFLDIDILPISYKFFNIFNFNTPAFYLKQKSKNDIQCINNDRTYDLLTNNYDYDNYIEKSKQEYFTIDGGIVLLKPNIEEYKNYVNFIRKISNNGIKQMAHSGIDETTIFYYFAKYKNEKEIYKICSDYVDVPWNEQNDKLVKNKTAYSYNYLSYIKPWKKAKFISWTEEHLWRDIYRKMNKTQKLKNVYEKNLLDGVMEFFSYENKNSQKRYYSMKYKKNNFHAFSILRKKLTYKNIMNLEEKLKLNKTTKDYKYLNLKNIKKLFNAIKIYNEFN